ncbi:NADH-quinone oxidoreductase subunit C [Chloroflexota bacterium]
MTVAIAGTQVANKLEEKFPGSVMESGKDFVLVNAANLKEAASFLKTDPDFDFSFLNYITSVDYFDYFEVIYRFTSIKHNHALTLKTRCYDRQTPSIPSVVDLWQGADFQEREIYDLMGISFEGHSNMKRIFLWDGFKGHPLRKDYL